MTWDKPSETHFNPDRPTAAPPLFAALQWALQRQWRGGIAYESPDGERGTIRVSDGRVVGIESELVSSSRLVELMLRAGVLDDRGLMRLNRHTRRTGMDPLVAVLDLGLVSKATLSAIREASAREAILGLLLDRRLRVRPVEEPWTPTGRDIALPIPFLLREAHRRHQEAPSIRQVVTGEEQIFVRSRTGSGPDSLRWEELPVSPAERQVFFYVDGRRTVRDLALATCQSLHDVSRALASLHAAGLIRPLSSEEAARRRGGGPGRDAGRSYLVRIVAMVAAIALELLALRAATSLAPPDPSRSQEFRLFLETGALLRVQAAECLFRMQEGRDPSDFEEILERRLVLPSDRKAALSRGFAPEEAR